MRFLSKEQKKKIGYEYILDNINTVTNVGAELKYNSKPFTIEKINICAITVNPFSTQDYTVDSRLMIAALKRHIDIPVFDVKGEIM